MPLGHLCCSSHALQRGFCSSTVIHGVQKRTSVNLLKSWVFLRLQYSCTRLWQYIMNTMVIYLRLWNTLSNASVGKKPTRFSLLQLLTHCFCQATIQRFGGWQLP